MTGRWVAAGCLSFVALMARPLYGLTPEQIAQLPAPASHQVDFTKEIKPIFEASCIKCHGRGKNKGGFRLDTRATFLSGGDSGTAIVPGNSTESLLVKLVAGLDPDEVMPKKGTRLTPEQVGLLRAWIDQGAKWDDSVVFGRLAPLNLQPRRPALPPGKATNPIDRLLDPYFAAHKIKSLPVVEDRVFARRAYLDVIGLLPMPDEMERFLADKRSDKRERLVKALLSDEKGYAQNWMTFWNDLLRNDYKGTGYIDGGRKQITPWLYSALLTNMPFNEFVAKLISPVPESEGFSKGFTWRGVVNASQTPQMQAAQNISQVFMGVNLKCASCHDSFINDLTLEDSYGLAGMYADGPLEMVQCDKPLGKKAELKFIYPELGEIPKDLDKPARLKRLAEIITEKQDGRLTRTIVNRFWQRLMGRGLIEPVDDMEQKAWNQDLLDWLAEDLADHNFDIRHLLLTIMSSRAYQAPAVNLGENSSQDYVFRGPGVRRMSAEEFRDALTMLTGIGYSTPAAEVAPTEADQKQFMVPIAVHWLWNDPRAADKAKPGHLYFRKTFELSSVPSDASGAIVCDNSFTLYVNGQKAGSGSEFKNAYVYDLRALLKPGTNVIAIDAVNHLADNSLPVAGKPVAGSENPAGLMFYARLRQSGKTGMKTNDLASDKSWICSENAPTGWEKPGFDAADWTPATVLGEMGMLPWRVTKVYMATKLANFYPGKTRASLVASDPLLTALGRPNREQVVTTRPITATTIQALELTNGETLAELLKRGGARLAEKGASDLDVVNDIYLKGLGRKPTRAELDLGRQVVGQPVKPTGIEDLLWAVTMLPEFQLIY